MPAAEALATAAQAVSKAAHSPRRHWKNRCRAKPVLRSRQTAPASTGASQEPASRGPRRKTALPSVHPNHASVPPAFAQTTNHIRNGLSGAFFSSLLGRKREAEIVKTWEKKYR